MQFDAMAALGDEVQRKKNVAYHVAGHAHWVGLKVRADIESESLSSSRWLKSLARQAMFLTYAIGSLGMVHANRNMPAFRRAFRTPQKVGLSLMLPIGAYGASMLACMLLPNISI